MIEVAPVAAVVFVKVLFRIKLDMELISSQVTKFVMGFDSKYMFAQPSLSPLIRSSDIWL
jgi:hypothetical protein